MIWALVNAWWLLPLAILACAAVAALTSPGLPALLALGRRVPAPAWAALGAVLAVSAAASWLVSVGEARCRQAQEAAEAKADAKADMAGRKAKADADEATAEIRKESQEAADEVRTIVRTLPATCPPVPDRLRDIGRESVEGARREMLPAPRG